MRTGFIGTGSMGGILIASLIRSGAVQAGDVTASNRTPSKVERLARQFPGLRAAKSNIETVRNSDILFLCVKPLEFKNVIDEIRPAVRSEQILVSITSPVLIKHLEDQLPCKIAKVIPSITNYECSGASLCMFGKRMTKKDRTLLEDLLRPMSEPLRISEEYTRITSDLSSCGPAFLCFFVQKFIDAAVQETGIPRESATRLASEMVLGTGKLLTSGGFTPESLQSKVSVPGGVTAEGLKMMESKLNGIFEQLIRTTHAKYRDDLDKVEALFYGTRVD